jgi:manganese/zinc/iron transport system substrate-binding protein
LRNAVTALVIVLATAALVATIYWSRSRSEKEAPGSVLAPTGTTRPLRVLATTGMVADLVRRVGGPAVSVTAMMGPGVDPHLYKASESDIRRMSEADLLFYSGLHLEGKLTEVFEQMASRGKAAVALADGLPAARLLPIEPGSDTWDPHVWFDVSLWAETTGTVAAALGAAAPAYGDLFATRAEMVREELLALHESIRMRFEAIPEERRILVTAHDAFGYFGRAYGLSVLAVQGVSTATEAGAGDIQRLAAVLAERRIPALFLESSVAPGIVHAVQAAVRSRGWTVRLGGELYSDAMGPEGSGAETYAGMLDHNVETIVSALAAEGER